MCSPTCAAAARRPTSIKSDHQARRHAALAAAGVVLGLGSDSPVTPLGPWEAVRAAALHHNPDQRLSVRAAFTARTIARPDPGRRRRSSTAVLQVDGGAAGRRRCCSLTAAR
jgi:hypothetical protein